MNPDSAMSQVVERKVTLPVDLAAAVDDAVEAGEYASASELIHEALRQWRERRETLGYSVEELRQLVQEGIDSGPGRFGGMEEIKAEARRRFKQAQRPE